MTVEAMSYPVCHSDALYLKTAQAKDDVRFKRASTAFAFRKKGSLIDNLLRIEENTDVETCDKPKQVGFKRTTTNFVLNEQSATLLPEAKNGLAEVLSISLQVCICMFYVFVNANLPIVRFLSKPATADTYAYSVGSVMLATTTSNILLGMLVTKLKDGSVSECVNMKAILKCSHLSVLSAILVVLKFEVLVHLTATLATMLEQLKLITLAFGSWIVFGKHYSSVQVMSLLALFLAMVQYALVTAPTEPADSSGLKSGLYLQVAFVGLSSVSTIMRELALKGSTSEPAPWFSIQQCHIAIPGLVVAAIYYILFDKILTSGEFVMQFPSDVFKGWDRTTVIVVIVMLGVDWLSNWIQKQLDSLVVQILGCVTIAAVWMESLFLSTDAQFQPSPFVALILVVVLAISFAVSTSYTNIYMSMAEALHEHEARETTS